MLSTNMFAYCLNNPANNYDPTGCIAIVDDIAVAVIVALICVTAFAATELLVVNAPSIQKGWESLWTAAAEAAANLTDAIAIPKEKADSVTKEAELDIPKTLEKNQYLALEMHNGALRIVPGTLPMSFSKARAWAYVAANNYSSDTTWGIYTLLDNNARNLAYQLGGHKGPLFPDPAHDTTGHYSPPYFSHYHTADRCINGKRTSFHAWFGPAYW